MVYSNSGENARMGAWRYMQKKFGYSDGYGDVRYTFFIYNGTKEELIGLKDYNALDSYISGMPDARSIYPVDLKKEDSTLGLINNIGTKAHYYKNTTLDRIQKLKKTLKQGFSIGKQLNSRTTQPQMLLNFPHNRQMLRIQNNIMDIIPPTASETIFKGSTQWEVLKINGKMKFRTEEEIKTKYDCCHIF